MSTERPTLRPVTLARLVEAVHVCERGDCPTALVESELEVTHRRARETLLEATRIGLLEEHAEGENPVYRTSSIGEKFLGAIRRENWQTVSEVLAAHSPHYEAFLRALQAVEPATLEDVLDQLETAERDALQSYNQTGVDVAGDWAERLGTVQRNAFTGRYYHVERKDVPPDFGQSLLAVYDSLEETAGVSLRQRYLSIPELREHCCERLQCPRECFDEALLDLAGQNVGKLELSGAPIDTGAKDATLGVKEIALATDEGLVTTSQSTEQVMAGVEQHGKRYYYLAVHDRDLAFITEDSP